jgi:hypothetical protein
VAQGTILSATNAVAAMQTFRHNPAVLWEWTRFRSEAPENATADEKIVLVILSRVYIQLRDPRPEVSSLTSQADIVKHLHIESKASLEYAGGSSCFAWICSSKIRAWNFH